MDGAVVPSTLNMAPMASTREILRHNYSLKLGLVTDIFYPEDPKNLSGKFIEYNVLVNEINSNDSTTMTTYRNCTVNNIFGMSNNNLTYTLQAANNADNVIDFASVVLLLCISGQSSNGQTVIVGGFSHPNNPVYSAEDGQFYDFNFNGINYNINNDGELTITFNSPLDDEKNPTNAAAAGSSIKLDKQGRIKIADNEGQFWQLDRVAQTSTWSNGNDSIVIDKKNKKIQVSSSGEFDVSSEKQTNISSGDAMSLDSQKDMNMSSDTNVSMSAANNMNQTSGGNWQVDSTSNVEMTAGADVLIEAGNIATVAAPVVALGEGDAGVGIAGISISIGTGNLGASVISTLITGSGSVFAGT